jgi:hypothetical protein
MKTGSRERQRGWIAVQPPIADPVDRTLLPAIPPEAGIIELCNSIPNDWPYVQGPTACGTDSDQSQ